MRSAQSPLPALAGALLLLWQTGCGKPSPSPAAITHARLDRVGLLYGQYASQHRGQPPKNLAVLEQFATQEISAEELARLSAADVGSLFTSPRDGKQFGFVALPKMPVRVADVPPPIVLYEQEGENQTRVVVYLGGGTSELNAEDFSRSVPSASRTVVAYER